jgi:cytochrome P450
MVLHPEAQKKAREELDSVLKPGRLPDFKDREKLPYIEALIKEVYRWNPVAPLGLSLVFIQTKCILTARF